MASRVRWGGVLELSDRHENLPSIATHSLVLAAPPQRDRQGHPDPKQERTTKTTLETDPPHPHHPIIPGRRQHVRTSGVPAHRVRVARVAGIHPAKLRQRPTLNVKR